MRFCDCENDGYCPRYGREMTGRFREICAGKNVDLGTAAAFREQWKREAYETDSIEKIVPDHEHNLCAWTVDGRTRGCFECGSDTSHLITCSHFKWKYEATTSSSRDVGGPPTPILLQTDQAPGDAVVTTAAIYSLHRAHPSKYITTVDSPYAEVFKYNPDLVPVENFLMHDDPKPYHELRMHYPAIHQSNQRSIHVMQAFCEHLGKSLGVEVPLLTNRPHLFFKEPAAPPVEDFWLICSGGKDDFTNKMWGHANYQSVVHTLRGRVRFTQVGGSETEHPLLNGCISKVGDTSLRQLFELTRRARGVLCGVTLLMHVAAALDKPAIIVAGGREPVQWNAYPRQHYMHTVGALPCYDRNGKSGACWRSRVIPLGDNKTLDEETCLYPKPERQYDTRAMTGRIIPKCMTMINPEQVANLILKYNQQYEV